MAEEVLRICSSDCLSWYVFKPVYFILIKWQTGDQGDTVMD